MEKSKNYPFPSSLSLSLSLFLYLFLILSCHSPLIKKIDINPDKAIMTANVTYSRNGYQNFDFKDSLKIIQKESIGGLADCSFLKYSGELIYTTNNGRLYFTRLDDIDDTRKAQIGIGIGAAPTISGTTLFIAVNKGKYGLIAYDITKGKNIWELKQKFSQSSPIVYKDMVIHAAIDGSVGAYNTITKEKKWEIHINDKILNNLALVGENLVVLTQNGTIRNYNPANGSLQWSLKVDDAFYASPVINSSNVFVTGYKGTIIKINLLKGNIEKSYKAGVPMYKTAASDEHAIYIPVADGRLIAFSINNLQKEWTQQLEGPFTTSPLVSNSEIIAGTGTRKLYRVNKNNGNIIQTIELEGRPGSQPLYSNHRLYITYAPDYIAVLSAKDNMNE